MAETRGKTILELEEAVKSSPRRLQQEDDPYLSRIHREKRCYYRDQLVVIRNLFNEWNARLIQKALVYYTELELYTAGELSSAVSYMSLLEEEKQNKSGTRTVPLPEKYRGTSLQIRDLSIYEEAMDKQQTLKARCRMLGLIHTRDILKTILQDARKSRLQLPRFTCFRDRRGDPL